MPSQVRVTGDAVAVFDPAADVWLTPDGSSKKLTLACLFNDLACALSFSERTGRVSELVTVPVCLTLDVIGCRRLDRAYYLAHPDAPPERSLFKGG